MLVNFHLQIAPPELMRQTQSPESVIVCLISQAICRDRVIALIRVHNPGAPGPSHLGTWETTDSREMKPDPTNAAR
jgi:hypothetical protein